MTVEDRHAKEIFEMPKNYRKLHPVELLKLFKKLAPFTLEQHSAQLIYKELTTYLTDEEENRIFQSWEHLHYDPGEFYSKMDELIYKYSVDL